VGVWGGGGGPSPSISHSSQALKVWQYAYVIGAWVIDLCSDVEYSRCRRGGKQEIGYASIFDFILAHSFCRRTRLMKVCINSNVGLFKVDCKWEYEKRCTRKESTAGDIPFVTFCIRF
jgi:hypothetical protein